MTNARLSAAINDTIFARLLLVTQLLALVGQLQPAARFLVSCMPLAQSAGAVKKTSIAAVGILDKGLHLYHHS